MSCSADAVKEKLLWNVKKEVSSSGAGRAPLAAAPEGGGPVHGRAAGPGAAGRAPAARPGR